MFEGLFQPMHLVILLIIVLLVFGPKNLPQIGRGLGDAIRGFKKAMREDEANTDAQTEIEKAPNIGAKK
jgi:sec-independent protein translocase protein TatA